MKSQIKSRSMTSRQLSGFTLVETLFVMTIMVILFAVAAAGAKKSWQSQELKASAIHLAHDLTLAAQTAQKLNKPVEVRFYKYEAAAIASDKPQYHAYQLFVQDSPKTAEALYEVQTLEGTTLISGNNHFSSIIVSTTHRLGESTAGDVGIGNYEYIAVEFRPNGSTNLPRDTDPQTLTLIPVTASDYPSQTPKDYQVIRIQPETGAVRLY